MPRTFSLTANDYGFGLVSREPVPLSLGDSDACSQRPTSRPTSSPGSTPPSSAAASSARSRASRGSSSRAIPASPIRRASCRRPRALLYDVFAEYDPDNLLLAQAVREVLERQLEAPRIDAALDAAARTARALTHPARPTPFAFPLLVEMFREELSTEALDARVARMVEELERAAAL